MDIQVLKGLEDSNAGAQARALQYFEELKRNKNGWKLCMSTLTSGSPVDDHIKFFCFQVIESYIRGEYLAAGERDQLELRQFLSNWIYVQTGHEKVFVKNKAAQVFALVCAVDFPKRWPSFFLDILGTLEYGPVAVDTYLRALDAINAEIIVSENFSSGENSLIKDTIRETCVQNLVDSWYGILVTYTDSVHLASKCLEVIGAFVSWIDINLIANDKFVEVLVRYLARHELREYALDCVCEIINKGMDPVAKVKLVESFYSLLNANDILKPLEDDESDYSQKLSRLVNCMGLNLIDSSRKVTKRGQLSEAQHVDQLIENKIEKLLIFLQNDYDDVSLAIFDFAREYLQSLKGKSVLTSFQRENIKKLLSAVILKTRYDASFNFEKEGEDEAEFLEFRKQLRVIFYNIASIEKESTLNLIQEYVTSGLQNWQKQTFSDVECTIFYLYSLGEAFPATSGNHFSVGGEKKVNALQQMMQLLITSNVVSHVHPAVTLQYFETVVRYDKFFCQTPSHIAGVLISFLDSRGMRNDNPKVRSRVTYLFSRFVRTIKGEMHPYTEDVLRRLQDLLVVNAFDDATAIISTDDQHYVFEVAGFLIVSGNFSDVKRLLLMTNLIVPLKEKFIIFAEQLKISNDRMCRYALIETMSHIIALISRTSKAFSNQTTVKEYGCGEVYCDILIVFLSVLDSLGINSPELQPAVKQYMRFTHRMVICLEEDILSFVPQCAQCLINTKDSRCLQDYISLINQVIGKFKLSWLFQKEILEFLQRSFMPVVTCIFSHLNAPIEINDEQAKLEKLSLQKSYFLFISGIVSNNVIEILTVQESGIFEQVLLSLVQGAVDFPEQSGQKVCFQTLRGLVATWKVEQFHAGFKEFVYKQFVPACFAAPMKNSFDLDDAQTVMVLNEIASCLKSVNDSFPLGEFVKFLHKEYLPTLKVSGPMCDDFIRALLSEQKVFKQFLKTFFQSMKSIS